MIDASNNYWLIDFGMSIDMNKEGALEIVKEGDARYCAPELLRILDFT